MIFGKKHTSLVQATIAYILGKKGYEYDEKYIQETADDFIKFYKKREETLKAKK